MDLKNGYSAGDIKGEFATWSINQVELLDKLFLFCTTTLELRDVVVQLKSNATAPSFFECFDNDGKQDSIAEND